MKVLKGLKMKNINLSRRESLKYMGITVASLPFFGLAGCGSSGGSETASAASSSSSSVQSTNVIPTNTTSSSASSEATSTATRWLSGNTSSITVDYPDDSIFENDSEVCTLSLTERTTEGPCYLGVDEKEDISEGKSGLPMLLCMQLVDEDCAPLAGYLIEVWHCDTAGIYSANTSVSDDASSFAGDFCTGGNTEAESSTWFRGEAYTDSSGRVNFKTCFPGWYSGRTIHIHYRVKLTNGGSDYIVSQFCFTDDFCADICTNHELYASRGTQDTTLSSGSDTVFPNSDYEKFIMKTTQNSDGSLLAYKRIKIGSEVLDDETAVYNSVQNGQDGYPGMSTPPDGNMTMPFDSNMTFPSNILNS